MTTAPVSYHSDDATLYRDAVAGGLDRQVAGGTTLAQPAPWFVNWATGNPGAEPGPVVNEYTALNYIVLYSCVSLIAGSISALPLITYKRDGRKKGRATDLPIYHLLHDEFNPRMSSAVARETMTAHLLTWGNEYAQIVRNKSGSTVLQINPLGPDIVDPRKNDRGEIVYDVYDRETGQKAAELGADEMIHVPGLGFDGLIGYSPVRIARHAIRAGLAQDKEAERFITRGIRPPGAIKFPAGRKFKDEGEALNFRSRFRKLHAGEEGSLNVLVLEDGAEWMQLGIDPESAQLLESRKFSRGEISGLYRVPPHLVGDVDKVTSWGSGVAEQVDGFVKFTLLPWLEKKEQEYNRKLFGGTKDTYCEHLLAGLERASIEKRTAALQIQAMYGAVTPNEWREIEDRNPRPGGDVMFFPLNVGRVDEDGNDLEPPGLTGTSDAGPVPDPPKGEPAKPPVVDDERNAKLAASLRGAIVEASRRCLRKEGEAAKRAAAKPGEFLAWMDGFYAKHAEMVEDALQPLLTSWFTAFPRRPDDAATCDLTAASHCERSKADLLAAAECPASQLVAAVERATEQWLSKRLTDLAGELTFTYAAGQPVTTPSDAARPSSSQVFNVTLPATVVNVAVHLPQPELSPPPNVTVNVPPAAAPVVNVQMPEQPAPSVSVHVPPQEPPTVNVHNVAPPPQKVTKTAEKLPDGKWKVTETTEPANPEEAGG